MVLRWLDTVDAGWRDAVERGVSSPSKQTCPIVIDMQRYGDVPTAKAVPAMAASRESAESVRWACFHMLGMFTAEERLTLISALGRNDPADAATLYVWLDELTDAEDAVLYDAFKDHMPVMVAKLQKDPSIRAKR